MKEIEMKQRPKMTEGARSTKRILGVPIAAAVAIVAFAGGGAFVGADDPPSSDASDQSQPVDTQPVPAAISAEPIQGGTDVMDASGRIVFADATVNLETGEVIDANGTTLSAGKGVAVQTAAPEQDLQRFSVAPNSTPPTANSRSICSFGTRGDNVHKSSNQASGHGWWIRYVGCSNMARVRTQLQSLWTNGQYYW